MSETTLEIPRPQRPGLQRSQLVLVFVAVAAASFLLGIVAATVTSPAPGEGAVVAEGDIDASGGTIRFPGGQLVFPTGAVDRGVHVVVRRSTIDERVRVADPRQPVVIDPGELFAYTFEPADVGFAGSVDITFRLPERARNATVFVQRDGAVDHLAGRVDPVRATATIRVRDFRFGAA